MKNSLTIILLILTTVLHAKSDSTKLKWSVGLCSGLVLRNVNLTHEYDLKPYNRAWENQLYVTKMIGKGFELDLSLDYQQKQSKGKSISMYDSATYNYNDKVQNLSTAFSMRYHFLKLNKTSFFLHAGFNLGHFWVNTSYKVFYTSSQPEVRNYKWNTRTGALILGTGARQKLTNRISATGKIDIRYKEHLHTINGDQNNTNWSLGALIGIAYHL